MSHAILFHYEYDKYRLEQEDDIINWLSISVQKLNRKVDFINYVFLSDEQLLEINQAHLGHDYYTDIITFPYNTNPIESDIFVSTDRIYDNALSINEPFQREWRRVLIHGVLHLSGYEDHTEKEKQMMREKENHYLDFFDNL